MDRQQAEQALDIIRGVIENTREDLIEQNWGLIWLIHAFTNAIAFACIGWLVESRSLSLFWYLVPLLVVAIVNGLIVASLADRDKGVRSHVEWQIHGIWVTFILVTLVGALVLYLNQLPPTFFCPFIAMTSAFGFAMTAVVFYRRFFAVAALFLVLAVVVSFAAIQSVQWYLLAAAWWVAMFIPGWVMFQEKKRRSDDEQVSRIL